MSGDLNRQRREWQDVLAALPDEAPPNDGWARLSSALDATEPRRAPSRRRWSLAIAATLAVLAPVLALRVLDRDAGADSAVVASHSALEPLRSTRAAERPTVEPMLTSAASKPTIATDSDDVVRGAARAGASHLHRGSSNARTRHASGQHDIAAAGPTGADRPSATSVHERLARNDAETASAAAHADRMIEASRPNSKHALARQEPNSAGPGALHPSERDTVADEHASGRTVAAAARTEPSTPSHADPLQPLYAESAQLEALLALTRDDRVGSATGAALSDALADQLVSLDAALAQPGMPDTQRIALWRERVATLRQLAGVKSTERWLAVHGRAYGDAFVRVD
jgi:hypothetical protein